MEFQHALARLENWQHPPPRGEPAVALIETEPSYLFVDGKVTIDQETRNRVEERGRRLGAEIVFVDVPPDDLRDLSRVAFFTDVLQLTQSQAYDATQTIFRLVRLRDGAVLWTDLGDAQRPFPVREMLSVLPARFEMFDSELEDGEVEVKDRRLFIQANVQVTDKTNLFLKRWNAFLSGEADQEEIAIDLTKAALPVPCFGGYGQCFSVPDPSCHNGKPCARRLPWEWVVVR
jgi:hypothetical protein